jgi:glycosyltransferase involved in cell wall biosynthesis
MPHYCFLTGLYSRYDVLMFSRQGKSLVEAGFKVTYVVCDNLDNETIEGIEIISTGFKPKNRLEVNADIYQISDPELISLVKPLKKKGKKIIFNMREYYPDLIRQKGYIPIIFRNLASLGYKWIMKRKLKMYDAVFIVTTWILDIVKDKWKIEKSYILTNFPRINKNFQLSYEDYCKRGDVLCYIGTIYSVSRQENIFSALESIPQVRYILAGVVDEGYNEIKTLPYWPKVSFIDGFTLNELPDIFAKSTISNVFRDFGGTDGSLGVIKIFESMEAALPVLLADVPLYRSLAEKYHCGICVNPNDILQIETAIRYLVDNKEKAYQMGQNGRRAVLEEYNWEKQAQNYISVINNL